MKNLILILAGAVICMRCFGATSISATLTITNAANINPTNSHSITVDTGTPDTRLWTNAIYSAATQILYTNSISQAAQRLLIHAATYPFDSCYLSQSGTNGITLRAYNDTPLTITLTNSTWGYVTYLTNTLTAAAIVRIPNTVESAATRTNIANGLVAYLNLAANTTAIDQTASVASQLLGTTNTQTIAGAKSLTNVANVFSGASVTTTGAATIGSSLSTTTFANIGGYFQLAHAVLNVDTAATNFIANFTGAPYQTITATNEVHFIQSTNRAAVRSTVIFIDANGANRSLGVNASWKKLSSIHTVVTNGTVGVLSLTVKGTAETDVYAAYGVTQ